MIENIFPLRLFRMLKCVQTQYDAQLNAIFLLMKHAHSPEKSDSKVRQEDVEYCTCPFKYPELTGPMHWTSFFYPFAISVFSKIINGHMHERRPL